MSIEKNIALLNFALDNVSQAVFLTDKDARFRYVNDEACRALGYRREELLGLGISDIDPDFPPERWPGHWDELKERGSITFEGRHRTKDGRIFPVEISANYFEYERQAYNLALVRHITERKRVEDTLRFIAQRGWAGTTDTFLTALAGYLADTLGMDYVLIAHLVDEGNGVAETSALYAKGEILHNMRYELKGTPCENVMGKKLCLYPKGIQALFPADTLLTDMGAESYAGIPLWDSAGRPIGLLAALDGKPIHDENTLSYILQLTATSAAAALERERHDRLLTAREREFRTLAENSPDFILRYDNGCRCIYANPRIENTLGIPAGGMLGKTPMEIFPAGEYRGYQDRIDDVLRTGANADLEVVVPDTGEGVRYHHVRVTAERDQEGAITGVLVIGRDISERKQMENVLRESEERFRTLTEKSPVGVYIIQDDLFRYVNQAFAAMHGYTPEEIIDKLGPDDFIMPDDRERVLAGIRSEIEFYHDVFHISRKDSSILVIEVFGSLALYRGRPATIGSVIDVTERKKAELALSESEARFRVAIENIPCDFWLMDKNYKYIIQNTSCKRNWGNLIGKRLEDAPVDAAVLSRWRENDERAFKGETVSADEEIIVGDKKEFFQHIIAPIIEGETVQGILGLCIDITERKRAEEALRLAGVYNRSLIEASLDPLVTIGPDGKITDVNVATEKITGRPRSELVGTDFCDYFTDPAHARAGYQKVFREGMVKDYPLELRHREGRVTSVLYNASVYRDEKGDVTGVFAAARDITERKRAEEERTAHLRFLENMDRVNRAFHGTNDLEHVMSDVLDVVLSIFDCERAYLAYPCDPEASVWKVSMERNRQEYPGVHKLGLAMPMDYKLAGSLRILLTADGPVRFGPGDYPLPAKVSEFFGVKSCMSMALYPKVDKPWQFGIHQCSHQRLWTPAEESLLQAIGRRLEDSLTSLLMFRDLRESEARYRLLVDTATEGVLVLGPDTVITFVNARMANMLGYKTEEMIGRPLIDFIWEDDAADHLQKMDNRRMGFSEDYERRFRTKDGRMVWTHASATPIFDEEQRIVGSFAMFTDITERKRAENALAEREREFRTLAEHIPDNIARYDCNGRTLYINPSLEETIGLTLKEVVGTTPRERRQGARYDRYIETLEHVIATGEHKSLEMNFPDGNNDFIHHQVSFVPERDQKGEMTGILAIGRDITVLRRSSRELLEEQKRRSDMALELSMAKERERHAIATELHDRIGQDLALAKIRLCTLGKAVTEKRATKILNDVREILDGAICSVRTLTRRIAPPILESGSLEMAVKCLCRQVENDYGLRVLFQDDGNEKNVPREIRTELYYAVRELLINVAKHAAVKSARVVTDSKNGGLLMRVEDDGKGFDPASVEACIMQEGSGFGLFDIRRRLIHLGGEFRIESSPGNGCRVTIGMPLTEIQAEDQRVNAEEKPFV